MAKTKQTRAFRAFAVDDMNKIYLACLAAGDDKTSEMYIQGGERAGAPRGGANLRNYFWLGAGRIIHPMPPKRTLGWACYMAGKDWAAQNDVTEADDTTAADEIARLTEENAKLLATIGDVVDGLSGLVQSSAPKFVVDRIAWVRSQARAALDNAKGTA